MKLKRLLFGSTLANVILLAAVFLLVLQPRVRRPIQMNQPITGITSKADRTQNPRTTNVDPVATSSRVFDWRQVESTDYWKYLANLRAIGCPEKTIRDIILADVNDLFASRMSAIVATNRYEFWRSAPMHRTDEQELQLRELSAQKHETLSALGADAPDLTSLAGETFRDNLLELDAQLEFLPGTKQQQVKQALFQQAQMELNSHSSLEQSRLLQEETERKIEEILSPVEFNEYQIRCSSQAQMLRTVLEPVAPNEQEFRMIFAESRRIWALGRGTAEYEQARQSSETVLTRLLGSQRFAAYLDSAKRWGLF